MILHHHCTTKKTTPTLLSHRFYLLCMAGVGGFEPPDAGSKDPCLTAWRHPKHRLSETKLFCAPMESQKGNSIRFGWSPPHIPPRLPAIAAQTAWGSNSELTGGGLPMTRVTPTQQSFQASRALCPARAAAAASENTPKRVGPLPLMRAPRAP